MLLPPTSRSRARTSGSGTASMVMCCVQFGGSVSPRISTRCVPGIPSEMPYPNFCQLWRVDHLRIRLTVGVSHLDFDRAATPTGGADLDRRQLPVRVPAVAPAHDSYVRRLQADHRIRSTAHDGQQLVVHRDGAWPFCRSGYRRTSRHHDQRECYEDDAGRGRGGFADERVDAISFGC